MKEINIAGASWVPEFHVPPIHLDGHIDPRSWQKKAFKELKNKMFRWVVAPPGSGKTTLMSMLAYNDIVHNGIEKVIILVPQNSIKLNYGKALINMDGELFKINPKKVEGKSVEELKRFLNNDLSNRKINAKILICTHQAMCRIDEKLLAGNISIWVDEAHHLSDDENDDESTNKLGAKIAHAISNCTSINIATATPARHDRSTLITANHRDKFVEFSYTIDRHIKEHTKIEELRFNVVKYKNNPSECITELYKRSKEPTIIWLPSIQSLNSYDESCKYEFAKKLAKAISPNHELINTKYGWKINGLTVVNLVDEEYRKEKLELISTGEIDTIIALEMFKEGDDCPKLSRGIKVGIRRSLVVNSQMNGRLFRHFEGKRKVGIYQVIPEVDKKDIRDKVSKLISVMILSIVDIEAIIGQPVIMMNKKKYKTGTIWEDYFGDQHVNMRSELISSVLTFDDLDDSRYYINDWCSRNKIKDKDKTKIIASVLSYMATNTKAFNVNNNMIDLDLIDYDDLFGWYSEAIGHDYLRKLMDETRKNAKMELLRLSKLGGPKPKAGTPNYQSFLKYCIVGRGEFDVILTNKMEKNSPHWFIKSNPKEELLELSKLGGPKPHGNIGFIGKAYRTFLKYCIYGNKDFDPIYTKKIESNSPHWFIKSNPKEELLELSKLGGPRISKKINARLYEYFLKYCREDQEEFDPVLTNKMEENSPHWFPKSNPKKDLLELSKLNVPKLTPKNNHRLYVVFNRYCMPGKYFKPDYAKEIESNSPHWFVKDNMHKRRLLELSKLGGPRPAYNDADGSMYRTFLRYCTKDNKDSDKYFNQDLTDKVATNSPHWFVTKISKVKIKKMKRKINMHSEEKYKKELLELSKLGGPKPSNKLYQRLYRQFLKYCREDQEEFDTVLTNKMKKNSPHWFPDDQLMEMQQSA